MAFELHPQLDKDCISIGRFALCRVLLMNDKQFPWLILVPEIEGVSEIYQLSGEQQSLLMSESCFLSERLATIFKADKMNIAAIGNLVPQLHIHHVVRYCTDLLWPAPIWGKLPAIPYPEAEKETVLAKLVDILELASQPP